MPGKTRGINLLGERLIVGQRQPAARSAQGFMGRARHDMGMRERAWMSATCDQPGKMRHIDEQQRSDFIGDFTEASEVPIPTIGRTAGNDQLWFGTPGNFCDLVHIDGFVGFAHAVGLNVEPLARHVDLGAVREVSASVEIKAHKRFAGLHQRQKYGLICLTAGTRLNVGEVAIEQLFGHV